MLNLVIVRIGTLAACRSTIVLSTTTILEIIAITAKTVGGPLGQPVGNYAQRLTYAAGRFALPQVPLTSAMRSLKNASLLIARTVYRALQGQGAPSGSM